MNQYFSDSVFCAGCGLTAQLVGDIGLYLHNLQVLHVLQPGQWYQQEFEMLYKSQEESETYDQWLLKWWAIRWKLLSRFIFVSQMDW